MPTKISVERDLGEFAKLCEVVELPEGILVGPKKGAEAKFQKMFQELYRKVVGMGGEYQIGKSQFLFPKVKPASDSVAARERTIQVLSIDVLVLPSFAIRLGPSDFEISDLAESFKVQGVLEPLVVRPLENGKFEVVVGSRRLKAAEKTSIEMLPCVIMDLTDQEAMELQFAENKERKDLSDYEQGRWLKEMMQRYPETYQNQTVLGNKIGMSQQHVSELISHFEFVEKQKVTLPSDFTARAVKLTEHVTREIQKAPEKLRPQVTKTVVEEGYSARETEKLVKDITLPNVTQEEAMKVIQEDAEKRSKAEEKRQEAFVKKLKQYYPAELVDYIAKRDGVTTDGAMFKTLCEIVSEMWQKLSELGLADQILKASKKDDSE